MSGGYRSDLISTQELTGMNSDSMSTPYILFSRLWRHITPLRRKQMFALLLIIVITSFFEVATIGAVLPFLGVLIDPGRVFQHPYGQSLAKVLGLHSPAELLLPLTIAFCLVTVSAGFARLFLLWFSTRLSFSIGADLSVEIYKRTLYQPYSVHLERNSSEIISGISTKTNNVIDIVVLTLTAIGSGFMLIAVMAALLAMNPTIAIVTFGGFGIIYLGIDRLTKKKQLENGKRIAKKSTEVIKSLQEGLGGIRDVIIDGSQDAACKMYKDADLSLRNAQASRTFIGGSPRFFVEMLGVLLLASVAYALVSQSGGASRFVPVLGTLALGAQRLLPVLQQIYASTAVIRGGQASLADALDLLDQPLPDNLERCSKDPLPFTDKISFESVSFRYGEKTTWILDKIDLDIPKGARVGVIGTTGSGKTTLLDILMGLLEPTMGRFSVDGREIDAGCAPGWRAHVAHVPQSIFLVDGTIEANIALGVPEEQVERDRVIWAAQQAQISEIVESWPEKYGTQVGERGVRISGGQRQRIGIARALYKQADVIVFDEATSALDSETEAEIMSAIERLSGSITILIIAHRLTTLTHCDHIIEVSRGRIFSRGSYDEMMGGKAR